MVLALIECIRISSNLYEPDPLLEVVLIGGLVLRDMSLKTVLIFSPLLYMFAIEGLLDLTIQLVQIHLVDPVLELQVLGIQLLDCFIMKLCLLLLA